jgi:hypothetical protein
MLQPGIEANRSCSGVEFMTVGSVDVNERGNQESSLYQALAVFFTLFMQNSG